MAEKRIVIRISDPLVNGYGHLSRTLALCEHLETTNIVYFIDKEIIDASAKFLNNFPYQFIISQKPEDFYSFIKSTDVVIFDSYKLKENDRKQTKSICHKLISIVDYPDGHYYCDALIQMTGFLNKDEYSTEIYTKKFIGYEYALLKKVFFNPIPKSERKGMLISMGGLDAHNLTGKILEQLVKLGFSETIYVICTNNFSNENKQKIYNIETCHKNVKTLPTLSSLEMCKLMDNCKYGIFPSSTVLLEALKRELICAFGFFDFNQSNNFLSLEALNAGYALGDMLNLDWSKTLHDFLSKKNKLNSTLSTLLGSQINKIKSYIYYD